MDSVSLTLPNNEWRGHLDLKTTVMSNFLSHPHNVGDHHHRWSTLLVPLWATGVQYLWRWGWGRSASDKVGRISILPDDCSNMVHFLLKLVLWADEPSGLVMKTLHQTSLHIGWMVGLNLPVFVLLKKGWSDSITYLIMLHGGLCVVFYMNHRQIITKWTFWVKEWMHEVQLRIYLALLVLASSPGHSPHSSGGGSGLGTRLC